MGFPSIRALFHRKRSPSKSDSTFPGLPGYGHSDDFVNQKYPFKPETSRFATATHAAKNALKTTLVIARDATSGLPLPVQGVIGAVINIIEIAEVISL